MVHSPEIAFFFWINAGQNTPAPVVDAARFCSAMLPPAAGLVLALLALHGGRSGRAAALQVATTMALASLAAQWLRGMMDLPRPGALGLGIQWLAHRPAPGLPSLHATGAAAFAWGLQRALPGHLRLWMAAWAVAALVMWSRVCLGLHFPSDVLAGLAVGGVVALSVDRTRAWLGRHGGPAWTLVLRQAGTLRRPAARPAVPAPAPRRTPAPRPAST